MHRIVLWDCEGSVVPLRTNPSVLSFSKQSSTVRGGDTHSIALYYDTTTFLPSLAAVTVRPGFLFSDCITKSMTLNNLPRAIQIRWFGPSFKYFPYEPFSVIGEKSILPNFAFWSAIRLLLFIIILLLYCESMCGKPNTYMHSVLWVLSKTIKIISYAPMLNWYIWE